MITEKANKSKKANVEVDLQDLTKLLEQSIVLLGHVNNGIVYHRRLNVLQAIMKEAKAKETLKDKVEILIGKRLQEDVLKTSKTKKKCKQMYKEYYKSYKKNEQPLQTGLPSFPSPNKPWRRATILAGQQQTSIR